MPVFLEIAVNVAQVRGVFHYHAPPELENTLQPGHLVLVPFGKQTVQGVVLARVPTPEVEATRPVLELVDPEPALTAIQIELARELSEETLSPLAACIELMLPPGLSQRAETLYYLHQPQDEWPDDLNQTQKLLLDLLRERGPLRSSQLERRFSRRNWRPAAQALARRGLLHTETILPEPTVRPKTVRTVRLACPPPQAEATLPDLARAGTAALERRQKMLRFILQEGGPVDVSWVYAQSGGNLSDLKALETRNLIAFGESETWRDPLERLSLPYTGPVNLTSDQDAIWETIHAAMQAPAVDDAPPAFLLHGVTGSGKTEIYLKAVEAALAQGRQAIILVPEIALTPQTVRRFLERFPGRVGLVHSRLSAGERYDTWRRARAGLLSVVVGPRSALFTPFPRLGLIVVDECHDESYYQSEIQPAFHARELAVRYAALAQAICLLGSATPEITNYALAQAGRWQLLHLPERILGHRAAIQAQAERFGLQSVYRPLEAEAETIDLPPVELVDMRAELKEGNRSIFSRALQRALADVLSSGRQAILFLNRLGVATYVFCRDCGYNLRCPRCELPLTFHAHREPALVCHHCGYQRGMPPKCPQCGGNRIRQYGAGTETVEAEVQKLFPEARTLRWDRETTRGKDAHAAILAHFADHHADILVGTQMLAKGLDLPLVTLVGVVLADVGLNLPDYRSAERVFQVLTQVAGRAGRGPLGGSVVLQTFQPTHYAIQAASRHDFTAFYQLELAQRRRLGYPPFTRLVRLEVRERTAAQAERQAKALASQIKTWLAGEGRRATRLIGPAPCFFGKLGGVFRWQVVMRGPDPLAVLRGRDLPGVRVEVDPPSLL
jgi:primosomal protein N' (replication factor Y) (superfamily II helicase)